MNDLEIGAASLLINMQRGKLVVKHGSNQYIVLYEGDLPRGGWNVLCKFITELTINGSGMLEDDK